MKKNNSIIITLILLSLFSFVQVEAKSLKVDKLELSLTIPEDYYPIYRDSPSTIFRSLGLDPTLIKSRMLEFKSYLMLYDYDSEIHISKTENSFTKEIGNLHDVNQNTINGLIEGYSKSFGDAKILNTKGLKFLIFNYDLNTIDGKYYYLKYKTIVNSREITINYISKEVISYEDERKVKEIVESIVFDNLPVQHESNTYFYVLLASVLISIIFFFVYLRKKSKLHLNECLENIVSIFQSSMLLIFFIFTFIWHLFGSWIIYQSNGFIWAFLSFVFPVISEVIIITIYIIKFGVFNLYILGWGLILACYFIFYLFESNRENESKSNLETSNTLLNIKCNKCKRLNSESNKYCTNCGETIEKSIVKYTVKTSNRNEIMKVCNVCDSYCMNDSNYCSNCGSLFKKNNIKSSTEEFGNGNSNKFFNILFNFIPIIVIITTIVSITNIYNDITMAYNGDLNFFLSFNYNKFVFLYFFVGTIFNILLIYLRISNNKNRFARIFIIRALFGLSEPILSLLVLSIENYNINDIVFNTLVSFIIQLIFTILIYYYLKKRIVK